MKDKQASLSNSVAEHAQAEPAPITWPFLFCIRKGDLDTAYAGQTFCHGVPYELNFGRFFYVFGPLKILSLFSDFR